MSTIDIIDVKAGIEEDNERYVRKVRAFLSKEDIFFINVMASPGAGKTTLLCSLIDLLRLRYKIGVIEADVDSDVDAAAVYKHGAEAVQLHTGGSCHMDAKMTLKGLKALAPYLSQKETCVRKPKLVFLENIGNLVCPAEFDTGADIRLVLLSAPEGDDKPLKYPLMFKVADCVALTKMDTAEVFGFSRQRFETNLRTVNSKAPVFELSAKTGEGVETLAGYLIER